MYLLLRLETSWDAIVIVRGVMIFDENRNKEKSLVVSVIRGISESSAKMHIHKYIRTYVIYICAHSDPYIGVC